MISRWLVLFAMCAVWGCTLDSGRAGESCKRSSQCQAGLGCVRGKCSKDLGPIANESTVPVLGGGGQSATEAGVMPAADGGMTTAGIGGAAAGSGGGAAGNSGAVAGSAGAAAGSGN
jgi:hypothetical protein